MLGRVALLTFSLMMAAPGAPLDGVQEPRQATRRSQPAHRGDGPLKLARQVPLVDWTELARDRSLYLGQRVRVQVQFHSWVVSWNPYLTRFGPGEFACLAAWSDEQFPWIREQYDAPAVRLFVRRGSRPEAELEQARFYGRYELVLDVRELLRERPWCEVVAVRPLERSLGEGTVIHAARAWTLIGNGTPSLAALELRRALAGNPPAPARQELQRLLDLCRAEDRDRDERPAAQRNSR